MSQKPALRVRLRVDFDTGGSIGPGKIDLLESIDACGSLSQAARDLGLSYRRAWLLLDDLNRSFSSPVVTTSTGGARGGGARLTDAGRALIEDYRHVERAAALAAERRFRSKGSGAGSAGSSPRASLRRRLAKQVAAR